MKHILIITEQNHYLATGHLQRMALLLRFLNEGGLRARIKTATDISLLDPQLESWRVKDIPKDCDLILRDMRDSTVEEIEELQKKAPVIAIDDHGPGRSVASQAIDLLPNPTAKTDNQALHPEAFLFGHTFANDMNHSPQGTDRSIDMLLYRGADPTEEYDLFLRSLVPGGASALFMGGGSSFFLSKTGEETPGSPNLSFGRAMLASRLLVSHFGISLYEGHVTACTLGALNPTEYHSTLTDMAELPLTNLGVWHQGDGDMMKQQIFSLLEGNNPPIVQGSEVYNTIRARAMAFIDLIT